MIVERACRIRVLHSSVIMLAAFPFLKALVLSLFRQCVWDYFRRQRDPFSPFKQMTVWHHVQVLHSCEVMYVAFPLY